MRGRRCIVMPSRDNSDKKSISKCDTSDDSFDDHSITKTLFDYILKTLPKGKTILELGSGWGTGELAKHYTMYSVEHDEEYLGKYDSTYIHVPLKEHKPLANHKSTIWYDPEILWKKLQWIKYDLLLVDGPPHTRSGFHKYFDLFDSDVIMVFDDYQREIEKKVMNSIASRLNRPYVVYCSDDGKPFAVINDPGLK